MVKWLVSLSVILLLSIGGYIYYENKQMDAILSKSELMEMDGYIYYLTPEKRWIFTTVNASKDVTSEMTYKQVENIVGMPNVHLLDVPKNSSYSIDSFKHGDAVTIWIEGILESYPTRVMPRIMEHR
jgi:hypothetical protein